MGAFDTMYHHELRAKLPQQTSAAQELRIHGIRSVLYTIVFAGLACLVWGGVWTLVLAAIVLIEVFLTLWDFLIEDNSRKLPWSERVLHTVLAINGGAVFCLTAIEMLQWWRLPNELSVVQYGWFTPLLCLFALGVLASGIRDTIASRRLSALAARPPIALDFGAHTCFLITGATGFIGQELVKSLLAQGHSVAAWVRDPIAATHQLGASVKLVTQLTDLGNQTFDVVINLAGESVAGARWSTMRKQSLIDSRVNTTKALVNWVSTRDDSKRPKIMLTASAIGFYGNQTIGDTRSLAETDLPKMPADFASQLCQAQEQTTVGLDQYGVRNVCIRLGVVFGHKGALPSMLMPYRMFAGGPIGDGRQIISWIHLHDVLRAIAHISRQAGATGAYNLTSPQPVNQIEFAKIAGGVLGRPHWLPAPARAFELMFGEMSSLFTKGIKVTPAKLLAQDFEFKHPDLQSALQQLEA